MNRLLFAAACFSLLLGFAHVFGGGPEFHLTALASNLLVDQKAVYSVLWHFASATLFINSAALFLAAFKPEHRNLSALVCLQFFAFGGLFIGYGMLRLGSPWVLPQWLFFALICVLAAFGYMRGRPRVI